MGAFIVIIRAAGIEKDLLGGHVVAVKVGGESLSLLRHATIASMELAFGKSLQIRGSEGRIGATRRATRAAAGATRVARGRQRAATGVTAARAALVACIGASGSRTAARAGMGHRSPLRRAKARLDLEREYRMMTCYTSSRETALPAST